MSDLKRYFYRLVVRYLGVYIRPDNSVAEDCPDGRRLLAAPDGEPVLEAIPVQAGEGSPAPDFFLLNGSVHYQRDIQHSLDALRPKLSAESRLVILYYNSFWRPVIRLATALGFRNGTPEQNWISPEDMENFLHLADYEPVLDSSKILVPVYIPLLSAFANRYLAPLPFFRSFCLLHIMMARKVERPFASAPSVSIVIPARNEAGNIEDAVRRIPRMGPDDEIIFVEGNSSDDTWQAICEVRRKYGESRAIVAARQEGVGKGDAVRKGFSLASREILMILDADLTVPPESLPLFYQALAQGKGEFINGSRLVYPMEEKAMRFLNMVGNKFFALAFSFVLGQRFKDILCGTKALTRESYRRMAAHRSYFGDFDPFGDFDLIFGAARMGLRIREVPVSYRERTYGETNIDRWRHGAILLRMLVFAARRIMFV